MMALESWRVDKSKHWRGVKIKQAVWPEALCAVPDAGMTSDRFGAASGSICAGSHPCMYVKAIQRCFS